MPDRRTAKNPTGGWNVRASGAGPSTMATSVRLPVALHEAAQHLVERKIAPSMTDLVVTGLRLHVGDLAATALDDDEVDDVRSALEEHYESNPDARPNMAIVVEAAARIEGHPAAEHPALIAAAIDDLGTDGAEVYVEDVLAWVRGAMHAPAARSGRRRATA